MSTNNVNDVEYNYLFKILIIGDSGVGKTAILQRFSQNYFSAEYLATIGVDFQIRTIDVNSKLCKLQVWDTAGQDRFKCVVSSFYRGAHGVMVCFDITDLQSFRNVNNWLEEVKRYCQENTPVYLVGTKSDLQAKRMVTYSTIKAYADERNISYIETSSKTSENVDNCFSTFATELVKHSDEWKRPPSIEKPIIPLSGDTNPVTNGGCFGGKSCTI
ncbi:unnamed protein product [Rotaria magnacalcarata]|uniref:Uncharacterized protein n=3 Tax=Rotaria magnacalcarata TaxID=392030 RepID=A0A815QK91_9BILA|nr:unnamed protein product [Rotaria magnacalcarata]CAF2101652.1 unnamed protein product [Rotaria magnacalcarata]CAF2112789.1 unnamed protein product [Rotaria magnacalcarata]CAF4148004.1 unnamed protein product [Rotaria magnacalcarata]CAF4231332.1 unnamed protein product [Rotaria magnacalcarata]